MGAIVWLDRPAMAPIFFVACICPHLAKPLVPKGGNGALTSRRAHLKKNILLTINPLALVLGN
jgi:hypothetical protein